MSTWLERILERPKAARKRIAFSGAVTATALIAIIWLSTLPGKFDAQPVATAGAESDGAQTMLQEFFSGVRSQVANVGSAIGGYQETPATTTSTTTVTAENETATATPNIILPTIRPATSTAPRPQFIQIATSSAQ